MKKRITLHLEPDTQVTTYRNGRLYSVWNTQVEKVVAEGDFTIVYEDDLRKYVQVRVLADEGDGEWTYEDTTGELAEGDLVSVPFGWGDSPMVARVVELGRGDYEGECKAVLSRYVEEEA